MAKKGSGSDVNNHEKRKEGEALGFGGRKSTQVVAKEGGEARSEYGARASASSEEGNASGDREELILGRYRGKDAFRAAYRKQCEKFDKILPKDKKRITPIIQFAKTKCESPLDVILALQATGVHLHARDACYFGVERSDAEKGAKVSSKLILGIFSSVQEIYDSYEKYCRKVDKHRLPFEAASTLMAERLKLPDARILRKILSWAGVEPYKRDINNFGKITETRRDNTTNLWKRRSPEEKALIGQDITAGLKDHLTSMSEEERKSWKKELQEHHQQMCKQRRDDTEAYADYVKRNGAWRKDNPERVKEATLKRENTKSKWTAEERAFHSNNHSVARKKLWDAMTDEEHLARITKMRSRGYVVSIDGKEVRFDSSWEETVYRNILVFGISFEFNKEFVKLGDRYFMPDFIFQEQKIILEVKGHPDAWAKFDNQTFPAMEEYWSGTKYSDYAFGFIDQATYTALTRGEIKSWSQLLKWCLWVYVHNGVSSKVKRVYK